MVEKYRKCLRNVKVISWELQHRLVAVDLDKKVLKKIVRKKQIISKIWELNENQTRLRFESRVKELVSTDEPELWKIFKNGVLKICDEVCVEKRSLGQIEETCGGDMRR